LFIIIPALFFFSGSLNLIRQDGVFFLRLFFLPPSSKPQRRSSFFPCPVFVNPFSSSRVCCLVLGSTFPPRGWCSPPRRPSRLFFFWGHSFRDFCLPHSRHPLCSSDLHVTFLLLWSILMTFPPSFPFISIPPPS